MFVEMLKYLQKILEKYISNMLKNIRMVFSDVRQNDSKKRWKAQLLFLIALNDHYIKWEG